MIRHLSPERDEADPLVTALLRESYAAPQDGSYWSALSRSIVARAEASQRGAMALGARPSVAPWWSGFGEWRQAGMVAAVAAIMAYAFSVMDRTPPADSAAAVVAAGRVLDGVSSSDSGHAGDAPNLALLSSAP